MWYKDGRAHHKLARIVTQCVVFAATYIIHLTTSIFMQNTTASASQDYTRTNIHTFYARNYVRVKIQMLLKL